ncbi:MAG: hypothetical protein K6G20_00715 [Ruminococcus sp.]|nr:hypothetical protein [Ruminococcus sp.]
MKLNEKALILSYMNNRRAMLERNVHGLQARLRTREVDTTQCLELALAIEALSVFMETTKDIVSLLNLNKDV